MCWMFGLEVKLGSATCLFEKCYIFHILYINDYFSLYGSGDKIFVLNPPVVGGLSFDDSTIELDIKVLLDTWRWQKKLHSHVIYDHE